MSLGIWQILLLVVLVLLLFGAGKLPNVMGDLAKGVKNFKKGLEEDDTKDEKKEEPKKITDKTSAKTTADTSEKVKDKN